MAAFPVTGRFIGDFAAHLVAVDTNDTIDEVAKKIATHSVGHRVARPKSRPGYDVLLNGQVLSPNATFGEILAEHGCLPLQWFDVRFREPEPANG